MTPNPRHIRIIEVEPFFSVERPAASFAFGAAAAGDLTLAHVRVRVQGRRGGTAEGWGAIFLSHPWAFPGPEPDSATKKGLMQALVTAIGERLTGGSWGHPLDHFLEIEQKLGQIAASVVAEQGVPAGIPALAHLVSLSPIDAAIHDAYGHLHGASSYDLLGPDDLDWDLAHLLGPEFAGRFPGDIPRPSPVARVPISHTVGATDPLTEAEADDRTIAPLENWIRRDVLRSFKVKLKGQDLAWDIDRLIGVHAVARTVAPEQKPRMIADLNEQAPSVDYILALLDGIAGRDAAVLAALDALEQPLSRNLSSGSPSLADVSTRIPVVLDEGLTSLEAIDQALELGWSGIALKTCKTQSLMLLALAKAHHLNLHVSVQDLTNPGIALLQSAGLAARLPVTRPIETNARQYYPDTSAPEASVFPGIYRPTNGAIFTEGLDGPGLGYQLERIPRALFHEAS